MDYVRFLNETIAKNKLTRKQVIEIFHLSGYEELAKVDDITLSRWLNGKSSPNLYKKLLTISCLKGDMPEFIKQVNIKEVQENIKDRDFILSYFRKVDNAHNAINYTARSASRRIELESLTYDEVAERFRVFHQNFSSYDAITRKLKMSFKGKGTLISCLEAGQVVGHIAYFQCKSVKIGTRKLSNVLYFTPVHYSDSNVLKDLLLEFFVHYVKESIGDFHYSIGLTRSGDKLNFHTYLGNGVTLEFFPPEESEKISESDKGLFLIKVDLIRYLSRKIFIEEVNHRLNDK